MAKEIILDKTYYREYDTWHSFERGVRLGEVRVIDKQLHFAGRISNRKWFRAPEVSWWKLSPEYLPKYKEE